MQRTSVFTVSVIRDGHLTLLQTVQPVQLPHLLHELLLLIDEHRADVVELLLAEKRLDDLRGGGRHRGGSRHALLVRWPLFCLLANAGPGLDCEALGKGTLNGLRLGWPKTFRPTGADSGRRGELAQRRVFIDGLRAAFAVACGGPRLGAGQRGGHSSSGGALLDWRWWSRAAQQAGEVLVA